MAKACGNIGNTLQLLGEYDEAINYSLRNLEMSKKAADSVSFISISVYLKLYLSDNYYLDRRGSCIIQFRQYISIERQAYGSCAMQS